MIGQQTTLGRTLRPRLRTDPQVLVVVAWLGLLLAFLVVAPLVLVLWFSFRTAGPGERGGTFTLSNYTETFLNPLTYELLLNTFWFSLGSIIIGLIIGVGVRVAHRAHEHPVPHLRVRVHRHQQRHAGEHVRHRVVLVLYPRTGLINQPFILWLGWTAGRSVRTTWGR